MTLYLSEKIRIVSFFSMILVVLLHAQLISISSGFVLKVQQFVTGELTRVAVPLFFVISGFLFFQNLSSPISMFFKNKIKKRVITVLVPYLFWSTCGFFFLFLMQRLFPDSLSSAKKIIGEYSLVEVLDIIFINPVGAYQLWFLKDLFIIVVFTPIIYWGIKYLRVFFILLLSFLWINGIQYFVHIESIFFFTLGAYIALEYKCVLEKKYSKKVIGILQFCLWLVFCYFIVEYNLGYWAHCLGILWGMWSLWCLYDILYPCIKRVNVLKKITAYSFFIYVTHEPLLTVVKKLLLCMGDSSVMILMIYFIAPLVTIFICISVGRLLKDKFHKFYTFISGGR